MASPENTDRDTTPQTLADPAKKAMDDKSAAIKATNELADADKAIADASKAQADARKAEADARKAEADAFKANTGEVILAEKAGTIEATLLAAKALTTAAERICAELPEQTVKKTILLYSSASEIPNFQALIVFQAQIALVKKGFDNAKDVEKKIN